MIVLKPTKAMDTKLADIYARLEAFKTANIDRLTADDKAYITASRREIARLRKVLSARAEEGKK